MKRLLATFLTQVLFASAVLFSGLPSIAYADEDGTVSTQSPGDAHEKKLGAYKGAITATHPEWFKESFLDFEEDIDEATADGKHLAIYLYQDGCPYCNQLWSHNMAVGGIEALFKRHFDVVAINMWGDREVVNVGGSLYTEKMLAEALDVDFTPTLIFYSPKKQPALRLNGYYPPEKFRSALEYVKNKVYDNHGFAEHMQQLTSNNQDAAGAGQALPSSAGARQPFFKLPPVDLDRSQTPGKRPLAVYFEPVSCPDCDDLHDRTFRAHPDTLALLEQMEVVQLDPASEARITLPDGRSMKISDWVREQSLAHFPAMLFFDEQGDQVMRMETAFRNFHTQSIFAYVLEKAYLTQPNFQRYISARAEHIREQGIDVDIWAH